MSYPTAHVLSPILPLKFRRSAASFRLGLALIFALAAIVHLTGLARLDIGTDEAYSFLTATAPAGVFGALTNDTNSPLYFLILKAWMAMAGTSLPAMRLLSALLGLAAVAALAAFAKECGASSRTIAWTLLLAAFTPVQLHYAQLARDYTLAGLLLTLALWSYVRALRFGRNRGYAVHGILLVLGAWTHALFVPAALGFGIVTLLMRISPRQKVALAVTYLLAAFCAAPQLFLVLHQARSSGGMAWLRDFWLATPPPLAIPKSLAILALGGNMPRYLLELSLSPILQALALLLTAIAVAAFFWPRRARRNEIIAPPDTECGKWRLLLVVFTLWPLLFVWVYSLLATPIYLVGRYDLFAQPAYLFLLALGFSRVQSACTRRFSSAFFPALVCIVLSAGIVARWQFPLDPQIFHHEARVAYLANEIQPGDAILCTGLEATPTIYWLRQRHIDLPVFTFPSETMSHPGWFISDDQILARHDQWPGEILQILNAESSSRVWILLDGAAWNPSDIFAPSPREELALSVLPTALANGWRRAATDPAQQAAEDRLRIVSLICDAPTKSPAVSADATAH